MTAETVMTLAYQAMKVALLLAAPMLLISLVVGLLISVFQAATQINEMTLTFIPKLLAICAGLVLMGPWLISEMVDYLRHMLDQIPSMVS
jgi:flagellar biosynthetic protein FliQ